MAPYQTNKPGISSLETASLDDASPQVNKGMEMMMLGLDRDSLVKTLGTEVGLRDWGYPGFLTELEFSIFEQFRDEVFSNRRDDSFRSTVFSFEKANEEVAYALCRWLRARKYNLQDTITMVEEATECTAEPRKHDFYPCPTTALSVESSLYIKQYPQLYYGHARNGCPVFISQPGMINIDAISSLTCIPKIVNYHWYAMMHEFTGKLKEEKTTSHGAFKRYECMCILDLNGLTATKIGKRELNLTKVQAAIDSLCFPETLNRMVIVNAPGYFTFTWKIIKGWIDQRTSAKVEVIGTNKEKLLKKLSALIDPTKLPSDYGGSGISINDFLNNDMRRMAESRRQIGSELKLVEEDTNLVSFSSSVSKSIAVNSGQFVKICFLTRSIVGCNIIVKESNSDKIMARINVVHSGSSEDDENETPSRFDLEDSGMVLHENTSYDVNFVSNGSKRKIINVMMVTKSFVVEDLVKVSNVEATEEKKAPITRSTDTKFCGSICTGVFSPENNNVVTVVSSSDMRLHNNSS